MCLPRRQFEPSTQIGPYGFADPALLRDHRDCLHVEPSTAHLLDPVESSCTRPIERCSCRHTSLRKAEARHRADSTLRFAGRISADLDKKSQVSCFEGRIQPVDATLLRRRSVALRWNDSPIERQYLRHRLCSLSTWATLAHIGRSSSASAAQPLLWRESRPCMPFVCIPFRRASLK